MLQNDFSIELKQGSITNQRSSGRCWMFAALNTLRYELMHRWNLEDFEFSETYLFFWEAMEKSNTYLENVLATLDEPLDSRVFEAINYGPADDGGWWQMLPIWRTSMVWYRRVLIRSRLIRGIRMRSSSI